MEATKIVPTEKELEHFERSNPNIIELIQQAQEADAADRELTLWTAIKKYKKAVAWSCVLSTALVMEGYDIVIVRRVQSLSIRLTRTDQRFLRPVSVQRKIWYRWVGR
jgi:hypothetical protein